MRREFRGGERWDEEDAQYTLNYSKLMNAVSAAAGLTEAQRDAIEEVLRLRGKQVAARRTGSRLSTGRTENDGSCCETAGNG